ncbi:MAG: hypothetical protein PF485_14140 [Bacteroidales bacterium]|jgi:hypothetical protein|nr:hypothetical protein [Bacteroidales bacterium]
MKAIKVTYVVKPEYVEQNKANIQKVMDWLIANPIEGMMYSSYILNDGQTFVHFNVAKDETTFNKLEEVQFFNDFRKALKESEPISSPKSENLNFVAAGFKI